MTRKLLAAAASFGLLASACGSGETEAGSDDQSGESSEYVYESPLGDFLGWTSPADFDEEAEQARFQEQEREVQEAIAVCMREQGFEYTPVDPAQYGSFEEPFEEEWGTEEWARTWGFGVSTQRYSQSQVGPDLVGYPDSAFFGPGEDFVDPNEDYVQSLSEDEQTAYYDALYGTHDEPIFEFEEEGREPTEEEMAEVEEYFRTEYEPTGCEPVAFETTFAGPDEEQYMAFDEEFGPELEAMYERMQASPEVAAYRAEVEACLAERGFDYLTEEDTWEYWEQRMNEAGLGWFDPLEGVDTTGWTDEQYEAAFEDIETQQLPPDQLEALAEIQTAEIESAVAHFECGGGWQQESRMMDEVRIELEREFLEANKDRLAQFEGVFSEQ